MTASSLLHHMDMSHGVFLSQNKGVDVGGEGGGGSGDICGIFSVDVEVGVVPRGRMYGKGEQPREA